MGYRRLVVAGVGALCAAPALAAQSPMVTELAAVIALHGWPCDEIADVRPAEGQWAAVTCRDGNVYEVLVRDDWDWHALERQTRLLPMLELGLLTRQLTADDPASRRRAVAALGAMGADAAPAVPALTEALNDPDPGVRTSAAEALAAIRGP